MASLLYHGASATAKNAYGNAALALGASPACKALLRRVLEGGEGARQRLRAEMDASAAALRERQERERAEREATYEGGGLTLVCLLGCFLPRYEPFSSCTLPLGKHPAAAAIAVVELLERPAGLCLRRERLARKAEEAEGRRLAEEERLRKEADEAARAAEEAEAAQLAAEAACQEVWGGTGLCWAA